MLFEDIEKNILEGVYENNLIYPTGNKFELKSGGTFSHFNAIA